MKKQTIYSYLQRSLVKVLTKSITSSRSKNLLAKPLKTSYASIASSTQTRPAKKLKNLGSIVFLLAKHKHSKTLNFFRKVNTKKSLRFTCKFFLTSFIRPQLPMLFSRLSRETLINLTLPGKLKLLKLKLVKLKQSLNNHKLLFFLLFLTYFFRLAPSNVLILQVKLGPNLLVNLFFVVLSFFNFNHFYRIKTRVGLAKHVAKNFGQAKKASKAFCFTCSGSFTKERSFFLNCNYNYFQLFNHSKKKLYLFQNKKEKNSNFYFYTKKPKPNSSFLPSPFGEKIIAFHQSFYKRKKKSINYIKTFHNLPDFFSLFFISTNNKIRIVNYAGLVKQILQAQEVLSLHKTKDVPCSFPLLYRSNTNIDPILLLLCSLQNTTTRTKKENLSFFFRVLPFLTIIFHVARKYLKKKKDFYKQATLKVSIYHFNKIIENNFLSFRPFYGKVVEIPKASNSMVFFLMRPLFALTRLDTFFICESLKLPIYPDKSNLRVDFLRNRVRKQILPAIRILLNPQFDTILCKFNESDS